MSKKQKKRKKPSPSKCKDCGATEEIPRYSYFKAARPKCVKCGGLLEYLGSFARTRSPKS